MNFKTLCSVMLLASIAFAPGCISVEARKVTTKHKAPKPAKGTVYPDFSIGKEHGTDFEDISKKIKFLAYDKKTSSASETFFIDNGSDKDLTRIEIEISYYNSSGKMIHKRSETIEGDFPSGETRRVDIKSWDRQKSFHYVNSIASKAGSTPYTVKFKIISLA